MFTNNEALSNNKSTCREPLAKTPPSHSLQLVFHLPLNSHPGFHLTNSVSTSYEGHKTNDGSDGLCHNEHVQQGQLFNKTMEFHFLDEKP